MAMTVEEIARMVGGEVRGDASLTISGVNGIKEAAPGDLTFVRGARFLPLLATTRASAVLIAEAPADAMVTLIVTPQPDLAFAQVLQRFDLERTKHPTGIHPTAVVGENTRLGENVALAAHVAVGDDCDLGDGVIVYPGVSIGRGCVIGEGTILYPNAVIREETRIGKRCILHAGVCIGSDGFGFAPVGGQWLKIPQVGVVHLGDDVEVGSNTCIDRATFGVTSIGKGTKIDNLVQIGHNVVLGEHCVVAGNAGIAGSAVLGNFVRVGAGAGIVGHIDIGDGASIGAWSGVTKPVAAGETVSGFPAIEHAKQRRVLVAQTQLPDLLKRVRELERRLQALEKGE